MFEVIVGRIRDPQYPRGCLFTNTSLECPSAGDKIGRSIAEFLGQQEAAIYQVVRRAQFDGDTSTRMKMRRRWRGFFLALRKA